MFLGDPGEAASDEIHLIDDEFGACVVAKMANEWEFGTVNEGFGSRYGEFDDSVFLWSDFTEIDCCGSDVVSINGNDGDSLLFAVDVDSSLVDTISGASIRIRTLREISVPALVILMKTTRSACGSTIWGP